MNHKFLVLASISLFMFIGCNIFKPGKIITQSVTVPTTGWALSISKVYLIDEELWVISHLQQPLKVKVGPMTGIVRDKVFVEADPDLPLKHFIIGEKVGTKINEPYTFIESEEVIKDDLEKGKLIWVKDIKKESRVVDMTIPEDVLKYVIDENMKSGSLEAASLGFQRKKRETFKTVVAGLSKSKANEFISYFENAVFVKELNEIRVYKGPFSEEGKAIDDLEFYMEKDWYGHWQVSMW